ncbi:MAG: ORF6N domain-containing protein [Bacteroidales bacterium]|jgi:hypothetical protein|nr:ORF6N domain-containing protein [Bacteroidales bacterium]MDD4213781.1 ORF6N domain-containing protein [Bacteroidales bacterium]
MTAIIRLEEVESKIIEIRNQKVLLDSDVAELYGVETKRVNEAVSNNPDKFPDGYIIVLTNNEWNTLKSKFSTSIKGGKTKLPKAFTERGLYMLATIMKSNKATQTTLTIIETFAKIKELTRNVKKLSEIKDDKNKKNLLQKSGEIIAEILDNDLDLNETETSIELNFAVLKFKHTIKKKKDAK